MDFVMFEKILVAVVFPFLADTEIPFCEVFFLFKKISYWIWFDIAKVSIVCDF